MKNDGSWNEWSLSLALVSLVLFAICSIVSLRIVELQLEYKDCKTFMIKGEE